ncbi:TetR/AcrR family transcriptional regulator [Lipingzhangella sp. LS1_29]|uniref:TetR/AcrR family transcriptional regulator n=1 Tax=Lipingzhangella rawalii TaxID=2055835 RepID=A0ABU2H4V8_9ACTN|nr:TetR/AcrR family transcriptional regulator [Lipingzhangella rawalii]MDS1270340.1 TetR/AcrR family transcriptional regulator [Lipingzhangella rawalii]
MQEDDQAALHQQLRTELPLFDRPPTERADAARNRRRILDAAARILDTDGPDGLAMENVAAAAGVGIGTLYRRFGSQGGLALALLDKEERSLQSAVISGPPPLGPGVAPFERLRAFLRELLRRVARQGQLLLTAETNKPHARFTAGAYRLHHAHVSSLLRQASRDIDAHVMADALLAPLTATLVTYQRDVAGVDLQRIEDTLETLVTAVECWSVDSGS